MKMFGIKSPFSAGFLTRLVLLILTVFWFNQIEAAPFSKTDSTGQMMNGTQQMQIEKRFFGIATRLV